MFHCFVHLGCFFSSCGKLMNSFWLVLATPLCDSTIDGKLLVVGVLQISTYLGVTFEVLLEALNVLVTCQNIGIKRIVIINDVPQCKVRYAQTIPSQELSVLQPAVKVFKLGRVPRRQIHFLLLCHVPFHVAHQCERQSNVTDTFEQDVKFDVVSEISIAV